MRAATWFVARSTAMRDRARTVEGEAQRRDNARAPMTRSTSCISDGSGEAGFYREVSRPRPAARPARNAKSRMASEQTKLSLSRPIYEHLKADPTPPTRRRKLYLTRTLGAFERAGIGLDAAGRAKAQALADEASKLGTEFEANIPKGQKTITATAAELDGRAAGLPRRAQARRRTARSRSRPTAPITCR